MRSARGRIGSAGEGTVGSVKVNWPHGVRAPRDLPGRTWRVSPSVIITGQGPAGRHRDRVLASARKCRAIQLKLQGLTYQQIADELGYTSRGTVYTIVKQA